MGWRPARAVKKAVSNVTGAAGDIIGGGKGGGGGALGFLGDFADDVLGIDDSGGIGGSAKKIARGVVSGVEVFADDFLGIDDSGGIIGSVKDIGSKFEDVVRDAVEEIDDLVQNPYVRLAVRFIPGYGQIAGAVLDTYAKLDSGEELTAADAVNLGTAFAAQDVSKWNLSEGEVKAIKAAGKIATGSDPIETLVTTFGPDIVDQMGLEEKVSTAVAERFGQDTYDAIKDNIDYARAGYEIAVEGKDPLQTIAKYADTPAIEEFGKRALTTTFGEDAYNLFRENIDVARAGVDVLQGKDVSMVVADRFGDDIVTALGAEDPTLRAAGLGTLRTAALLDQGVPDYIAVGSGAKTFYEKGGTEGVQDYLASLDTSGLGTSLGVDLQPLTGALARGEDIVRETFTPEQREQARLLARDVKTLTTAASRGAASFEDTLRSVLPENVELASVTGGDIDAYRQELSKNLEGFDYSLLMPEGGYRATGGQGQYVATGGPSQYGKARTLFGVGESPIDQQMGSAMPDLAQLPEMAQLPTIGTEEEEEQMPFQLGQVQTAREGGRFEKPQVQSGMRIPDDGLIQKNMDIIRRMPDVFYMNPGVAQTAAELDQIYAYNDRIAEIAMGSREAMQVGGVAGDQQVVEENQVVSSQPAGFIERAPEQVPEGATVADDVPLDVEDGTFVINAPAVEFAGSDDIKKMIMEAIDEAKGRGLDISFDGGKIPEEEAVSLLVSRGEVIVPPILAKIIGYDRLEKINNRGKKEVQKRASESKEETATAKSGGFIAMRDGGEVDPEQSIVDYHYNTIQQNKVGRDKEGRPITVYSTSIYIPEGKNKGKFALVPGYVDGSIDYSEDQLYEIWKEEIESGKWPIDSSGEESGKRAQRIHQVMDRDADTMPELKKEGGLTSFRGEGTSGDNQSYANIEAEYSGDGFIVKPRANYSEQNTTRNFPDGVVVNQKGKNIGFALNGEMFLSDDTSLRAGVERQANRSKTKVNLPENYGGQTLEFGGGQKMKRYNMGATFGDFSADISKQQGAGQPLSGRVEYKFSPQGEVFIEGTEGGRSGRVGLQYRF
jgi:hypothetical protein